MTSKIGLLRRAVQAGFGLFVLYAGYQFYLFFLWAAGQHDEYAVRPPAVEGFLPISALMALKQLALSGRYDPVHPAGLTIFLAALLIAVVARKGFCGWICPVGLASNLADETGRGGRFKLERLPAWVERPLLSLKYLLLFFFLYQVVWRMDLASISRFQQSEYNLVAEGKMLLFFLDPTPLAGFILLLLVLASFLVRNLWCRYLCPYGALLGMLVFFSPLAVRRRESACIGCKRCDRVCPGSVRVSQAEVVRSPACVGCLECVGVCPQPDCLQLSLPGGKKTPVWLLPLLVLGLFFLAWGVARLTGHWQSDVAPDVWRHLYPFIDRFGHP